MNVVIDVSLQHRDNAYRGVGTYTRLLFDSLKSHKSVNTVELIENGQVPPNTSLIHYPYFDLFFRTLKPHENIPFVVTVHDLIPLVYANHYWPGIKGSIRQFFQIHSLKKAGAIITDSETSRQDIHNLLQMPLEKISVVYLAADPELQRPSDDIIAKTKQDFSLNKPYLLYVGDINYNKNLPALIRSFAHLKEETFDLVLVSRALGSKIIPEAREVHLAIADSGLEERVRVLTNVPLSPKQALAGLYAGAEWYVQPSLYEGFGLPVLEAMQCGTPVVASLGGSLKELVNETNAVVFKPESEEQILKALRFALDLTANEKEALTRKGIQRATDFSWQKVAQQTQDIYEKVLMH